MLVAPSPKKQMVTRPSAVYLLLKAAPAASARWPPTMPQPPMKLVSASKKCMEPPRPRAQPVSLPNSSAMPFSGDMPRASVMPWSR